MLLNPSEEIDIANLIDKDPVGAIEELFGCQLWEKQKEIAESVLLYKNKKTAVRSCHDSGKSFVDARIALLYLIANRDSLVLTTAPGWTQVKEILWREIRAAYAKLESRYPLWSIGGRGSKLLDTSFDLGENWFALGLATRKEGQSSEVAERMLGFHSPTGKILIIVDEGSGVEEPIYGAIDGLLTSANAQLLSTGNPYRKIGSFAKMFSSKRVYKIHIQDIDTPNIKAGKIVVPGLMSPDYPKEMEEKYGIDSNLYRIKVKGDFPTTEADTLIPVSDLEAAFLREVEPVGIKRLGVDVARFGDDKTVLIVRQGAKVLTKERHSKEDTMETAGRILTIMDSENILAENIAVDDIGVGGGVVDRLHEKGYNVEGVNVGMSADDEEHFYNIRAEAYWQVRAWIKVADLPKDEDFYQLANIKYKWSSEKKGQLKIEKKDEIKKRGLESPDTADALMLTFTTTSPSPFPGDVNPTKERARLRPITAGLMAKRF